MAQRSMSAGQQQKLFRRFKRGSRAGMRGSSLVKKLLFIPLAFVVLLLLAISFFEGRKAYWDYQVRKMCEKDGG
ncbi:hypothetical protein, partial [Thiobacter aerophilum]